MKRPSLWISSCQSPRGDSPQVCTDINGQLLKPERDTSCNLKMYRAQNQLAKLTLAAVPFEGWKNGGREGRSAPRSAEQENVRHQFVINVAHRKHMDRANRSDRFKRANLCQIIQIEPRVSAAHTHPRPHKHARREKSAAIEIIIIERKRTSLQSSLFKHHIPVTDIAKQIRSRMCSTAFCV